MVNNKIIKKNLLLIIVGAITLLAVIVLSYFVAVEHSKMQELISETTTLKDKIISLRSQKPAPVQENIDKLGKDTVEYQKKIIELLPYLGHPEQRALDKFCLKLGVNKNEFVAQFRDFWEKNTARKIPEAQIFRKFIYSFPDQQKWSAAILEFKKEYQNYTSEKIEDNDLEEILFATMGVKRALSYSPVKCNKFMVGMQKALVDTLVKAKVPFNVSVANFTYDLNTLPKKEDIPKIIIGWDMIDDLVRRIAASGVSELSSLSKTSMDGVQDGDYLYYSFRIIVSGNLPSIRKLISNLYSGYSDCRVYLVRGLQLRSNVDPAWEMVLKSQNEEIIPPNAASSAGAGTLPLAKTEATAAAGEEKKEKQEEDEDESLPPIQRKSYGKILIGGNVPCTAIIDVDYVVYVGKEYSF